MNAWPNHPAVALSRGAVIVDNLIPGMTAIADAILRQWPRRLDSPALVRRVPHSRPTDDAVRDDIADHGVVLLGLGNCGACTTWLSELGADLVVRIPTAVVVTERFAAIAEARLAALGEPTLPVLVVPDDAADAGATDAYLDGVADRLIDNASAAWRLQ